MPSDRFGVKDLKCRRMLMREKDKGNGCVRQFLDRERDENCFADGPVNDIAEIT